MAAKVLDFGVRRGFWPAPHVCGACGSSRDACRGFPNDVWYCAPCVPPELRYPWEPGYAPVPTPATPSPAITTTAPASSDLLSGFASA